VWPLPAALGQPSEYGFNPHTRAECDEIDVQHFYKRLRFQSTHSRGVWLTATSLWSALRPCFNPHTRAECDPNPDHGNTHCRCFNPHTRAECDQYRSLVEPEYSSVSIHTLARSVTRQFEYIFDAIKFQSTHSRGVWPEYLPMGDTKVEFQSTHSRGVWQKDRRFNSYS